MHITDLASCVPMLGPLPGGGNPTAVNKYRIISYIQTLVESHAFHINKTKQNNNRYKE